MPPYVPLPATQVKPAKVMFGITSPMLCNATIDSVISEVLNPAAAAIMSDLKIPTIDLHQVCFSLFFSGRRPPVGFPLPWASFASSWTKIASLAPRSQLPAHPSIGS